MSLALLDNIVWHSLAGPHARFAAGNERAKRYARGFSQLVAFADPQTPDWASLESHCEPGEHFYCAGWTGTAPPGWRIEHDTAATQMVWDAGEPDDDEVQSRPLGPAHVPEVLALAQAMRPGPFAERTIELGDFFGVFDRDRLVAMTGERMHAGELREVSGVCTYPEYQGRGLARRLVAKVVRLQLARGQLPFLHVMCDNVNARRLYRSMGFREHQILPIRVVVCEGQAMASSPPPGA